MIIVIKAVFSIITIACIIVFSSTGVSFSMARAQEFFFTFLAQLLVRRRGACGKIVDTTGHMGGTIRKVLSWRTTGTLFQDT